jgi:hypothetical protein
MATAIAVSPYAWVFTDIYGRIEMISPSACEFLGSSPGRGDDLLMLLPIPRKTVLCDMRGALKGCPARRTVVVNPFGVRPLAVTYRVSPRLGSVGAALFWQFDLTDVDMRERCA